MIGRNNAGKSVISRLPLLLARALSEEAEGPLELTFNGLDFGGSFRDFIHNRFQFGAITLGASFLEDDDQTYTFEVELQYFDEKKLFIIDKFTLESPKYKYCTIQWLGNDPIIDAEKYQLNEQTCQITFQGLFPKTIIPLGESNARFEEMVIYLNKVKSSFARAMKNITYLGPFRDTLRRTYTFPGYQPKNMGFAGKYAPVLLGDDYLRRRGKVVDSVGKWFKQHIGGWILDISKAGDSFALVFRNPDDPTFEINIADMGAGISQVLPIIVQHHFALLSKEYAQLAIIEQPELHLHPKAHTELADLYITGLQTVNTHFIIETHSENFILRIRRRIAEGTLDHKKVIIYWIDDDAHNRIQEIQIDHQGAVSDWPSGVFSEDFEEAKAIRMSQRRST